MTGYDFCKNVLPISSIGQCVEGTVVPVMQEWSGRDESAAL
jgi:hypothetical protein